MSRPENQNSVGGTAAFHYDSPTFDLTAAEFDSLLGTLCVDLGCCLNPEASRALWEARPDTIDEFVDALLRTEGQENDARPALRATVKSQTQQFIAACQALSNK